MEDNIEVREIYKYYCYAEGNQHIASEYAIVKLQELIERRNITSVLELGLGIGSIAGTLLKKNKQIHYFGTETNSFCRNALIKNLGSDYQRLNLFTELSELPAGKKFDMVIIDGKDSNLDKIPDFLSNNGLIAIEGDRMPQQNHLIKHFPNHKLLHLISIERNKEYSPFPSTHRQGGVKLILVEPSFFDNIWWIKEKIKTKMKYQIRKWSL